MQLQHISLVIQYSNMLYTDFERDQILLSDVG